MGSRMRAICPCRGFDLEFPMGSLDQHAPEGGRMKGTMVKMLSYQKKKKSKDEENTKFHFKKRYKSTKGF